MSSSVPSPLVTIRVANNSDTEAIQRCRFDVYSEMGYINPDSYPDKREYDSYDSYSVPVIASHAAAFSAVGTTRLILSSGGILPIQDPKHHAVRIEGYGSSAEISRLCVRKNFRDGKISLGMYRVLFHIVDTEGIDTVFAIMDEGFYKTITWLGFPFVQIGGPKEHMGLTIPYACAIDDLIPALRESETANMFGITELFERPFHDELLM